MNNTTKATPAELRLMRIKEHLISVFFDRMKKTGGIYTRFRWCPEEQEIDRFDLLTTIADVMVLL